MDRKIIGLALDPSLTAFAATTFSISVGETRPTVLASKTFTTAPSGKHMKGASRAKDDLRRATVIGAGVADILAANPDISIVCTEVPVGSQSHRSSWGLGIGIGLVGGGLSKYPRVEVTPAQVKEAGYGKGASKKQQLEWLLANHPECPVERSSTGKAFEYNHNVADSVAVIYAAIKTRAWAETMKAQLAAR